MQPLQPVKLEPSSPRSQVTILDRLRDAVDPWHGECAMYAAEIKEKYPQLISAAIQILLLKLNSADIDAVHEAISGLSVLGHSNREAVKALASKLRVQDQNILISAANALGEISTKSINANSDLMCLLNNTSANVVINASFALLRTDPNNDAFLRIIRNNINSIDLFDQPSYAYELFTYDSTTALEILERISLEDAPASLKAISLLGIIGSTQTVDSSSIDHIKNILKKVKESTTNNAKTYTVDNVLSQLT